MVIFFLVNFKMNCIKWKYTFFLLFWFYDNYRLQTRETHFGMTYSLWDGLKFIRWRFLKRWSKRSPATLQTNYITASISIDQFSNINYSIKSKILILSCLTQTALRATGCSATSPGPWAGDQNVGWSHHTVGRRRGSHRVHIQNVSRRSISHCENCDQLLSKCLYKI